MNPQHGGVIHTYQGYDPAKFPSPTQPPPDMVSGAMEQMLAYGSRRRLTAEQLAKAVKIDPSQIRGLGPSLDALIAMLEERKRKLLEKYETASVVKEAAREYLEKGKRVKAPSKLRDRFEREFKEEQIYGLERLWYAARDDQSAFAKSLLVLMEALGEKYQIDALAAKYAFTGREVLTIPKALEVKEELEKIDRLLEQLRKALETAQIVLIDMNELAQFAEPGDIDQLQALQQQVEDYLREQAERQGLETSGKEFRLTPKAMRLFQSKLLERIFNDLKAGRTGRHDQPIVGEGSVELARTKPYEFGDSVSQMDIPATLVNTMLRQGGELPLRLKGDDIVVHQTRNRPKCATALVMDMSGSMRYEGQYINVKRMALALEGLIRREYPGDYLQFIEMFSFAKPRLASEVIDLMPKPVTITEPMVRLWADMSDPQVSETMLPPHFTNIQHGLQLARQFLVNKDTPNRQIVVITDGLPTAHFEGSKLFFLYPPDPRTEEATMREAMLCQREGIVINLFLLQSWSQTSEDIRFAYKLAETTKGRVVFTAGRDLDRYVVWDYLKRRREIIA